MREIDKYTTLQLEQFYVKYSKQLESDDPAIVKKAKKFLKVIEPEIRLRENIERLKKLSEKQIDNPSLNRSGRLPKVEKKKKKLKRKKKKK